MALLIIWSFAIKGVALWHAGRQDQFGWYVTLYVVHTAGILDLIYLLGFRKDRQGTAP
jgi:hypothetical protein